MKTLFLTLALAVSLSFNSAEEATVNRLCQTTMDGNKFYSLEQVDGKTYFVTHSRMSERDAFVVVSSQPTSMDCGGFASWAAAHNLTLAK